MISYRRGWVDQSAGRWPKLPNEEMIYHRGIISAKVRGLRG